MNKLNPDEFRLFDPGPPDPAIAPPPTAEQSNTSSYEQLKMFMTGKELRNYVTQSWDRYTKKDDGVEETMDDMWNRKIMESEVPYTQYRHGSGLRDSLSKRGYIHDPHNAIKVMHVDPDPSGRGTITPGRYVTEGHHRIAALADIEEESGKETFVPISHKTVPKTADEHFPWFGYAKTGVDAPERYK
jgi:hypothetical protein